MSALEQSLEDYLDNDHEAHEGFRINDLGAAEWAARKLAAIAAKEAEVKAVAQAQMERIEAWLAQETAKHAQSRAFFEQALTDYHVRVMQADPSQKSIKLPHATLKSRKQQPAVTYDEDAIVAWAKAQGREIEFVRVKEEPIKSAVKAAVLKDGEHIPGVEIVEQGTSYTVEVIL